MNRSSALLRPHLTTDMCTDAQAPLAHASAGVQGCVNFHPQSRCDPVAAAAPSESVVQCWEAPGTTNTVQRGCCCDAFCAVTCPRLKMHVVVTQQGMCRRLLRSADVTRCQSSSRAPPPYPADWGLSLCWPAVNRRSEVVRW